MSEMSGADAGFEECSESQVPPAPEMAEQNYPTSAMPDVGEDQALMSVVPEDETLTSVVPDFGENEPTPSPTGPGPSYAPGGYHQIWAFKRLGRELEEAKEKAKEAVRETLSEMVTAPVRRLSGGSEAGKPRQSYWEQAVDVATGAGRSKLLRSLRKKPGD